MEPFASVVVQGLGEAFQGKFGANGGTGDCLLSRNRTPHSVEALSGFPFAGKGRMATLESESRLQLIGASIFQGWPLRPICIPALIRILGMYRFGGDPSQKDRAYRLRFESHLQPRRIEESRLQLLALKSIHFPQLAEVLVKFCFLREFTEPKYMGNVAFESASQSE
jgi:hypothetical protein